MCKGGPPECGVPRALGEGVWEGFRPSSLEGVSEEVSEGRGGALGEGCRGGAWALHGRREAPRAEDEAREPSRRPGAQVDREGPGPVPFRSFAPLPHCLPHRRWTPNRGWVPLL